jgi:hypothetical protein
VQLLEHRHNRIRKTRLQNSQQPKNRGLKAQLRFGDCNGRLPYIPDLLEEKRLKTAVEHETHEKHDIGDGGTWYTRTSIYL